MDCRHSHRIFKAEKQENKVNPINVSIYLIGMKVHNFVITNGTTVNNFGVSHLRVGKFAMDRWTFEKFAVNRSNIEKFTASRLNIEKSATNRLKGRNICNESYED